MAIKYWLLIVMSMFFQDPGPINIKNNEYSISLAGDWSYQMVSNPDINLYHSVDGSKILAIEVGRIDPELLGEMGLIPYAKLSTEVGIQSHNEFHSDIKLNLNDAQYEVSRDSKLVTSRCSILQNKQGVSYLNFFTKKLHLTITLEMEKTNKGEVARMESNIIKAVTIRNEQTRH